MSTKGIIRTKTYWIRKRIEKSTTSINTSCTITKRCWTSSFSFQCTWSKQNMFQYFHIHRISNSLDWKYSTQFSIKSSSKYSSIISSSFVSTRSISSWWSFRIYRIIFTSLSSSYSRIISNMPRIYMLNILFRYYLSKIKSKNNTHIYIFFFSLSLSF